MQLETAGLRNYEGIFSRLKLCQTWKPDNPYTSTQIHYGYSLLATNWNYLDKDWGGNWAIHHQQQGTFQREVPSPKDYMQANQPWTQTTHTINSFIRYITGPLQFLKRHMLNLEPKKIWKTQIETWFGIRGVKIEEERGRWCKRKTYDGGNFQRESCQKSGTTDCMHSVHNPQSSWV